MHQLFARLLVLAPVRGGPTPGHGGMAAVTADPVEGLAGRLSQIRDRVKGVGGDLDRIRIVAVTKGWGPETVRVAFAAGLRDIGENYAQELLTKAVAVPEPVRWHFLGPVQRNKVARLAPLVHTWHGIDRPKAADAVAAVSPGSRSWFK